ncbi:hypothetical protein LSAT2_015765, partial [Lamellibrachia satsuma]
RDAPVNHAIDFFLYSLTEAHFQSELVPMFRSCIQRGGGAASVVHRMPSRATSRFKFHRSIGDDLQMRRFMSPVVVLNTARPVVVLITARPVVVLNTARPVVVLNTARPVVVSRHVAITTLLRSSRCGPSMERSSLQASGAGCVWWSI